MGVKKDNTIKIMSYQSKALKKYSRSRRRRARRGTVINRNTVNFGLQFPKKIIMTHKYTEIASLTSSTSLGRYSWKVNSMFDPNSTGVGHQPLYFDQMAALYNNYCVIGSKCVARFFPSGSLSTTTMIGGYINDNTAAAAVTDYNTIVEQSLGKKAMLLPGCSSPAVITLRWSGRKQWGKGFLQNPNMTADTSNDPAEKQYFDFFSIANDGTTSVTIKCEVTITYIAVWRELVDVSGSS